jgi:hypothetical protein
MANQSKQKKQSAPTKAKPAQKRKKVSHPTEPSIPVNPVPSRRARVQTEEEAEAELGDTIVIDDNEEETDDIPVIAIASDPEDNAEEDAEAQLGKHEPESQFIITHKRFQHSFRRDGLHIYMLFTTRSPRLTIKMGVVVTPSAVHLKAVNTRVDVISTKQMQTQLATYRNMLRHAGGMKPCMQQSRHMM